MGNSNKNNLDIQTYQPYTYGDLVHWSMVELNKKREQYRQACREDLVLPLFPSHVQIQTTNGCNAQCIMCARNVSNKYRRSGESMDSDLFMKIAQECALHGQCTTVSLYLQGEPLLDKHLAHRIHLLKELSGGRLQTRIVTNGSLLTPDKSLELIESGLDVISISLNAHSPEVYSQVMQGLDYHKTMCNVNALLKMCPPHLFVMFTFIANSLNLHELPTAINYWSRRGYMCGAFFANTFGGAVANEENLVAFTGRKRIKECFVPIESAIITVNGNMLLCCSDWEQSTVFGNTMQNSIKEIWHSEALSHIRLQTIMDRSSHPLCEMCHGQTKTLNNLLFEGGPGRIFNA